MAFQPAVPAKFTCAPIAPQEVTSNDITCILNEYTHYMLTEHNQPAGDKDLRLHHAKQLKNRYPKLCKNGSVAGHLRKWFDILSERKRNLGRKKAMEVCRPPVGLGPLRSPTARPHHGCPRRPTPAILRRSNASCHPLLAPDVCNTVSHIACNTMSCACAERPVLRDPLHAGGG